MQSKLLAKFTFTYLFNNERVTRYVYLASARRIISQTFQNKFIIILYYLW